MTTDKKENSNIHSRQLVSQADLLGTDRKFTKIHPHPCHLPARHCLKPLEHRWRERVLYADCDKQSDF